MNSRAVFPVLFVCAAAFATQTDNLGIHAVPAPGKVAIDGKLDDWDLSGQVLICYDIETLRDVYSADVAMMHDAGHFYVAIHWKDSTPMGNSHHPRYQAVRGWAGDSVQLRFKTDRISHITAWYYAPTDEPGLQISYGKSLTEPFKGGELQLFRGDGWKLEQGAEMAFLKDADGRGYVQEIKIPWALIVAEKKPQPGEQFSCGIELLWGETDWPVHRYADNLQPGTTSREFFWTAHKAWGAVFVEAKGKLALPEPAYLRAARAAEEPLQGPVEIRYDLPRDARVTLAIDDANGHRVRNLIAASKRKKGPNTERWDGLDDAGKLQPPGSYRFTALHHEGIHVNYVMSFANPGNPTWDSGDGRGAFYGDHTAPQAVAGGAGGNFVALACPMGEAGKHLIGCDLEGQRLWGLNNRVAFDGGRISLASDGKILWVASEGKKSIIYRVDMATGRYAPWRQTAKDAQGNDFQLLELEVSALPGVAADWKQGPNVTAIAVRGDMLAVCLARENKIELRDAHTGESKKQIAVDAPRSLAFDTDGSLIALAGGKLLRIAADGAMQPFNGETIAGGYSLAVDAERNVYLSVRGADQNVKVFAPDGILAHEIGKRGGRTLNGAYDENAMRNPAQIAVDGKGRLWVTEETMNPKRTSVWSVDGKLLKDLAGTTHYASAGAINPDDPTMGFSDDTVFRLDLSKGEWRTVWSLARRDEPNDIFPGEAQARSRAITRDGVTLLFSTGSAASSNDIQCTIFKDGVWRSAANFGTVRRTKDGKGRYAHAIFDGHDGEIYAWADKNGDALVQPDELQFGALTIEGEAVKLRSYYWGQLPDADGTICYIALGASAKSARGAPASGAQAIVKFAISGFTACGAPIYDVSKPRIITPDRKLLGGGNGEGMMMGGSGGRVYLNQDPLICVTQDGRVLGGYPSKHTSVHGSHAAKSARPGYVIGPSSILGTADFGGEIGEVWDLNGNLGENYLFTHDCLFIQSLFKDTRGGFETPPRAARGMAMDAITAGGESFGGNFVRARDGKVYLTIGGTDARVMEVTGLETIRRLGGDLSFTAEQFAEAQRMAQEKAAQAAEVRTYKIAKAAAPPFIDGKATDWPELTDDKQPLMEIQESAQKRCGRVQARYDAENLYVAWRVLGRSKPQNSGQDFRLLFKSGDAVDLMLGPDPQKARGEGNLRLLLALMGGKPVAVLNQKAAPGAAAAERFEFASPWRAVAFDRVALTADVKMATGAIPSGYFVEAAIPWKTLGVEPKSGLKLKGDAGVLLGDTGGTQTIARQYWCNKATGLVSDVPGEADLTPQLWGGFVLE